MSVRRHQHQFNGKSAHRWNEVCSTFNVCDQECAVLHSSIQVVDAFVHVTGYTIQLLCLVTRKIRNFYHEIHAPFLIPVRLIWMNSILTRDLKLLIQKMEVRLARATSRNFAAKTFL